MNRVFADHGPHSAPSRRGPPAVGAAAREPAGRTSSSVPDRSPAGVCPVPSPGPLHGVGGRGAGLVRCAHATHATVAARFSTATFSTRHDCGFPQASDRIDRFATTFGDQWHRPPGPQGDHEAPLAHHHALVPPRGRRGPARLRVQDGAGKSPAAGPPSGATTGATAPHPAAPGRVPPPDPPAGTTATRTFTAAGGPWFDHPVSWRATETSGSPSSTDQPGTEIRFSIGRKDPSRRAHDSSSTWSGRTSTWTTQLCSACWYWRPSFWWAGSWQGSACSRRGLPRVHLTQSTTTSAVPFSACG